MITSEQRSIVGQELTPRVAMVTGGSSGIGRAISKALAMEGYTVAVLASHDQMKARAVVEEIRAAGGNAEPFVCDVRNQATVRHVMAEIERACGPIDVLVNSAGVFYATPLGETSEGEMSEMIDINLRGTLHCINAVAGLMKQRGAGKILNISSIAAYTAFRGFSVYSATKAAIVALTRAAAYELAPHGINVVGIAPGNTATPMNEVYRTDPKYADYLRETERSTPSGRPFSEPAEIAAAAVFLVSTHARAVHGATLLIDEGLSAGH